jgi:hypothetical protein
MPSSLKTKKPKIYTVRSYDPEIKDIQCPKNRSKQAQMLYCAGVLMTADIDPKG